MANGQSLVTFKKKKLFANREELDAKLFSLDFSG